MPPKGHARCGGSVLHRRIACPASLLFEGNFDDPGTSPAAEEGTRAHALLEACLNDDIDTVQYVPLEEDDPVEKDGEIPDEMYELVQSAIDVIHEFVPPEGRERIETEMPVEFSNYVPDPEGAWGTADVRYIDGNKLYVFDLKYGYVPVSSFESAQLRIMALGALNELEWTDDIQECHLSILQPRLGSYEHEIITPQALKEWAAEEVTPKILRALEPDAHFNPGESQCKFCRANVHCKARTKWVEDIAVQGFEPESEETLSLRAPGDDAFTDDQLVSFLNKVSDLEKWCKDLKEYVRRQTILGVIDAPGWGLKQGRTNRKFKTDVTKEDMCKALGLKSSQVTTVKLKSPAQVEKLLPKKSADPEIHEALEALVTRPTGKTNFVKISNGDKKIDITEGFSPLEEEEPCTLYDEYL